MAKKRGPAPGQLKTTPIYPDRVLQIVRLRDERKSYREIADLVGGTRMNAYSTYKRWHTWARQHLVAA